MFLIFGVLWNFDLFCFCLGGQNWSQWRPRPPDIILGERKRSAGNCGLKVVSCFCMFGVMIFRTYIDFSELPGLDVRSGFARGVFVGWKSGSLRAKFRGNYLFPIKLVDFPTKFLVLLVKSRHQAKKEIFVFSLHKVL